MKTSAFRFPGILTDGLILLAGTVFILWPGSLGYEHLQAAKFDLFLLLFGGYLLLMALFSVELLLLRHIRPPSPAALWRRAGLPQKLIFLYWLATAVSALLSPFGSAALLGMTRSEGLVTITVYCGCFLCVSAFARPKSWWLDVLGVVMSLFSALCLIQLQGGNPLGLFPDGYTYFDANIKYGGIYLGTTGNADLTAALLCLTIPLFWVAALRRKDRHRWWLAVPLALSLTALVQMDVQAGLAGVLVGTALTIPVVAPASRKVRGLLWGIVAACAAVGLIWVWNCDRTWDTFYELREILHGNWDPAFGSGRIYIWQEVLERIPDHWLLGTGPDTMAAAAIPGYSRQNPITGEAVQFYVDVAHNEYLNILYHQGLPALLFYAGALVSSAVRWLRRSRDSWAAAALGGGVLCYCVQAFFGFSMCQTAGVFWIVWGLLERVCEKKEESL